MKAQFLYAAQLFGAGTVNNNFRLGTELIPGCAARLIVLTHRFESVKLTDGSYRSLQFSTNSVEPERGRISKPALAPVAHSAALKGDFNF
jgi:hypothetical protein